MDTNIAIQAITSSLEKNKYALDVVNNILDRVEVIKDKLTDEEIDKLSELVENITEQVKKRMLVNLTLLTLVKDNPNVLD